MTEVTLLKMLTLALGDAHHGARFSSLLAQTLYNDYGDSEILELNETLRKINEERIQKHLHAEDGSPNWKEWEHPRDKGKFTNKGEEYSGAGEHSETRTDNHNDFNNLLGKEYKGYKGQEAIHKLLFEKQGHIKAAFHRNDIGDIDLIWGDDTCGLQHIIKRRSEQGTNIDDFFSNISEVITKGAISNGRVGRFEIFYEKKVAVIAPEIRSNKLCFLLTAYKRRKP